MLQINQLVCLVSRPVSESVALRQAVHLMSVHNASSGERTTLHVVSARCDDAAAFKEAVWEVLGALPAGIAVETRVLGGNRDPAVLPRMLQRYAAEVDVDLLVLDPPSDRGVVPPLADDQTTALVEALPCPLFLVGEAAAPASTKRILVPTDLSDESVHTLRHATELAAGYDASVVLLHVIDTSPYVALTTVDRLSLGSTTLTEHRARRRLQQFLQGARPPDVPIRTRIAFGEPADRIAHVVAEQGIDLLVLASHGAGAEPSLGPVADRVLRRVACPTILVRAGDRALLPGPQNANSAAESSS
jgi:nucleotide-binding universal stress UspA family protein